MFRTSLSTVAVFIALASFGTNTQAQTPAHTGLPENQFTGKAVFERTRDAIRSALCPQDQRIFDSIDFYFPNDTNIERVRAGHDPDGKRAVEISTGYMNFSALIVQSTVYDALHEASIAKGKHWPDYISYLAWTLNNQAVPVTPTEVRASVQPYHSWAGIPEDNFAEFLYEHQPVLRELMLDVFVFALLHEVGHHVLNHTFTNAIPADRSRVNEWEADLYAIAGLSRLGQSTLGVLPYFIFSSDLEGVVDEPSGTHDPAICRGLYILADRGSFEFSHLRRQAASACGKRIKDTDAAYASKTSRSACYRPPSPMNPVKPIAQ